MAHAVTGGPAAVHRRRPAFARGRGCAPRVDCARPEQLGGQLRDRFVWRGSAIIDAGNHSGIVIKNLSGIKISSLVIRGDGGTTDNDDLLAMKNGILITSQVDAQPAQ